MAKASKTSVQAEAGGELLIRIGWIALAAGWLFLAASMAGFDPADPPTHAAWPANAPVRNWCGPVGASVAYHIFRLLGIGAWVLAISTGVMLGLSAFGRRVGHPGVRLVGLLMLAAAVSGLQGLVAPRTGAFPDLAGGLVGAVGVGELQARFSTLGTLLWLLLLGAVGGFIAFDRWMILAPAWAMERLWPAGQRARDAAIAGGGLLGQMARAVRERAPSIRVNDLDDDEELAAAAPKIRPSRRERKREMAPAATAARPVRAVRAPEPEPKAVAAVDDWEDAEIEEVEDEAPEEELEGEFDAVGPDGAADDEDDDDLPGAPQVFDDARLRDKISRLPVVFSRDNRTVATEDDLRDLQNVGELEGYRFPGLELLDDPEENFGERLEEMVRSQAENLEAALREYRIDGEVVGIESGPVITLYDVRLAPGTKVSRLQAVSSDIARALKAVNVRIVANQEGRDTVGIEAPNPTKEKVRLKELMGRPEMFRSMKLPMFLGKDAAGEPLIADLTRMPHMLIAGTTGSGKSVCMNTIIMSFLYTRKPNELRLVLVDPKMVEMSQFKDVPHLMCPVVTEMSKAAAILEWATRKMDERYELLAEAGCRDIASYNELTWEELKDRFEPQSEEEEARIPRKLPYMVFVIDELADLIMTAKEVEGSIIRIAQKARAVGIHLILATQRPQANVVTGLIKSNMPCRVSFRVASGMDSRIVLDQKGGELLLGQGDMLYLSPHSHKLIRSQGTLVTDPEIRRVARFMRDVARPTFERQLMQIRAGVAPEGEDDGGMESENNSSESLRSALEDPLFDRAVEIVLETKRGSVSLLQRRLAIGYTRSSRLIDLMGIAGIISDHKGSVARDVLISPAEWERMKELAGSDEGEQQELFRSADRVRQAPVIAARDSAADAPFDVDDDAEQGEALDDIGGAEDDADEYAENEAECETDEEADADGEHDDEADAADEEEPEDGEEVDEYEEEDELDSADAEEEYEEDEDEDEDEDQDEDGDEQDEDDEEYEEAEYEGEVEEIEDEDAAPPVAKGGKAGAE
jgi:S-DNA-T family DNA segregation ATPase FtsK/SpoIIIE